MYKNLIFVLIIVILSENVTFSQEKLKYQRPPESIANLLESESTPYTLLNPQGTKLLILHLIDMPSIDKISQPELRLAGLRINPLTNGQSRSYSFFKLAIKDLKSNEYHLIKNLPNKPEIENITWSPDGKKVSFTITKKKGLELWITEMHNYSARSLSKPIVSDIFNGIPYQWAVDSRSIYTKTVVQNRGLPPEEEIAPYGPIIQSNTGGEAPVLTYQDLLSNKYEEDLFKYYATCQIKKIGLSGDVEKIGAPGIYESFSCSPDNKYILLEEIIKPFSYIVPYYRFSKVYKIIDNQGNVIKKLAHIPVTEKLPKGFAAVRTGAREFNWRSDVPASIYWVEALDGGDPFKKVEFRDQLFYLKAPFDSKPSKSIKLNYRFDKILWYNNELAIVYEYERKDRRYLVSKFNPEIANKKRLIFKINREDRYNHPGRFIMQINQYGRNILLTKNNNRTLFLKGEGASPKGDMPFISEFDLKTKKAVQLWRCKAPYYTYCIDITDVENNICIIRKESKTEVPNYYLFNYKEDEIIKQLTNFKDPYPSLKGIYTEVVNYTRKDGVKLNGKLYLPPGYNKIRDGKLPVLMWAYPEEFQSSKTAGQISGSPYKYIRLSKVSPLYWLAHGYAIFDHPSFPIIGENGEQPNDTYIKQLVDDAEAAVDKLIDLGIADKKRIAIGGHSYGAFMVANLLTHSDLFAAGIARSGAYNRTLTPFGFQAEERTFWEARNVYMEMSPFTYAEKMNEPLLLIHGAADNNSGTYPMQSERYFAALKGNGAIVRLVMLPNESHGYRAYESIMHMSWEMTQWLDKYVKNKVND